MKTTRVLLCLVFVVCVLIACSGIENEVSDEEDQLVLEKTYDGGFFSIDYPAGFTPLKISEKNPGVIISSKDTDLHIEAYSNWNSECREGDLYRLWHNGEDYWDELTETRLGGDPAMLAYTENEYDWSFISTTVPKMGWEMIATVTNFSKDELALARQIVMSLRITDEDYSFDVEGPQYEPFDHNQELIFSDQAIETDTLRIKVDGEIIENKPNNLKIDCSGFEIAIVWVDDWMMESLDSERLLRLQNWEDVSLGASVVAEVDVGIYKAVWSETLREPQKSMTVTIPFKGGYLMAVASNLDSEEEIRSAGSALYSIEIIDHLQFRSR